jgi:hypothetical protein
LYIFVSSSITIHYQNPTDIRSSSHVCVVLPSRCRFPFARFLACAYVVFPSRCCFTLCTLYLPMIILLSTLSCYQKAPNTDMWLIPIHLILLSFLDLLGDRLELFLELCCLCLRLCSLLLDSLHYLSYNFVADQFCTFYLGLCYLCLIFLCLCLDFYYTLLQWFHLRPSLLFLGLRSDYLCLQNLHFLHPFDVFCDWYCLILLLELLDH